MVIALDSSYADKNSFNVQKTIAKHIIRRLTSQVPKYKIHILLYDGDTIPSRLFTNADPVSEINSVIDLIPNIGGSRKTEKGLAFVAKLFRKEFNISEKSTAMYHSSDVLVFFATGRQHNLSGKIIPKDAARELRDLGIKVLAVGTQYTPMSLLHQIGHENAFRMPTVGLSEAAFANTVSEKICSLVRKGNHFWPFLKHLVTFCHSQSSSLLLLYNVFFIERFG